MNTIGAMQMPCGFKYKKVHEAGRPLHAKYDEFWRTHIPMEKGRRAKIFAPFDALDGFDERIAARQVVYTVKKETDPETLEETLSKVREGSCAAIRYFIPCRNPENEAFYLSLGTYRSVSGTVGRIDMDSQFLILDGTRIRFEDIGKITVFTGDPLQG